MRISSLKGGYNACHKKMYEEIQGIYLLKFIYLRQNVYKDLEFEARHCANFEPSYAYKRYAYKKKT